MGQFTRVLNELKREIDTGISAGPQKLHRYGMIEGKSPSNNNNGILVETKSKALAASQYFTQENHFLV